MPSLAGLFTSLLSTQSALAYPHEQYESTEPQLGAVASESSVCSTIGIDLLKAGGNAADALVGTTLCVGVIGMYHSGTFEQAQIILCTRLLIKAQVLAVVAS